MKRRFKDDLEASLNCARSDMRSALAPQLAVQIKEKAATLRLIGARPTV